MSRRVLRLRKAIQRDPDASSCVRTLKRRRRQRDRCVLIVLMQHAFKSERIVDPVKNTLKSILSVSPRTLRESAPVSLSSDKSGLSLVFASNRTSSPPSRISSPSDTITNRIRGPILHQQPDRTVQERAEADPRRDRHVRRGRVRRRLCRVPRVPRAACGVPPPGTEGCVVG